MYPLVTKVIQSNCCGRGHYAEPFAGGCGLALALLYGGHVSDIHINDVDTSIWALWYSILNNVEEFVSKIENTPVTVEEWQRQKTTYLRQDERDLLALGFSSFFLNRTNRSGIINGAGVIGGLKQNGPYKIGCRFNKEDIIRRVRRVAKYRSRIHLTKYDALVFLDKACCSLQPQSFFFIDPPYLQKGASLYTNYYNRDDHEALAQKVQSMQSPWVMTYDNDPYISQLYCDRRQHRFGINYSLEIKRKGTELLIVSDVLDIPYEVRNFQKTTRQQKIA